MKVFLSVKNPEPPNSVFPSQHQLAALKKKYGDTGFQVEDESQYKLYTYETGDKCFSTGSRQFNLFIDQNACTNITRHCYDAIISAGCLNAVKESLFLLTAAAEGGTVELSLAERDQILKQLAGMNRTMPGSGLTEKQVEFMRRLPFEGCMARTSLDSLDTYIHNKRLYDYAIEQLMKLRLKNRHHNEKLLSFLYPEKALSAITRFLFISYGSLWHQDVWNNLSVETLIGDLNGEYGAAVDCSYMRILDESEIPEAIALVDSINPDIIGFSIEIRALGIHEKFEAAYRHQTTAGKAPLIVYGNTVPTYACSYFAPKYLTEPERAVIILGYGEISIRQVISFSRKQCGISEIANAVWRDETGQIRYNHRQYAASEVVHPPAMLEVKKGVSHMLEASRGCRFNCTFCAQGPHSRWDPIPIDRVIENIELLLSRGVHELEFVDNEFFGGRNDSLISRAYQVAEAIKRLSEKYGVRTSFRIFTNPLIIAREGKKNIETNKKMRDLLKYMKECGLTRLYIGIESASENQRKRYNRKDSLGDVVLSVNLVRELGIALDAGFITFDPLMDLNDIRANVYFFKKYNLIEANTWPHRDICIAFDTPMLNILKEMGLITGVNYYELYYTYKYASEEMAEFADTVLSFGAKTGKLFQVLKYSTKELFNDKLKNKALLFSRKMVDENAYIFLELMDDMVKCLEKGSRNYKSCLERAERSIKNLVRSIEENLSIYDKDSAYYPKLVKNLNEAKIQLGMEN